MLGGYLSDSEVIKKMSYLVCCLFILAQPSLSSYGAQLWSCAFGPLIIMSQQHGQSGPQWTESSEALSVMFQTVVLLTFSACVCHWHIGSHSSWKALPFMSKLFKGNVPTSLKARESGWEGGVCLPTSSNALHSGDANRTVFICSPQREISAALPEILMEECLSLMSWERECSCVYGGSYL